MRQRNKFLPVPEQIAVNRTCTPLAEPDDTSWSTAWSWQTARSPPESL